MAQMYKVFNDNIPLVLHSNLYHLGDENNFLYIKYEEPGEWKYLLENVWGNEGVKGLSVYAENLTKAWLDFKNQFKVVMAAGGLVKNGKNDLLVITRNGYLDLPKGHIEDDELSRDAAIREVGEECGLSEHKIRSKNPKVSYHIYTLDGQKILKMTYWYEMTASLDESLKAQEEEGISDIKWMSKEEIKKNKDHFYLSLIDLLG